MVSSRNRLQLRSSTLRWLDPPLRLDQRASSLIVSVIITIITFVFTALPVFGVQIRLGAGGVHS